jgi:hypothetical protein
MGGNSFAHIASECITTPKTFGKPGDDIQYALRITFGIVHGVLLTLCSFGLALFFPSLSRFLFTLFGFIIAPLLSFVLTILCNGCIQYVSQATLTITRILKTSWIPPLGVFCTNLVLLPLELMPSFGPITIILITSILVNLIVTILLQIYAARDIQEEVHSSKSAGASGPT